jgi:hypothetical protein
MNQMTIQTAIVANKNNDLDGEEGWTPDPSPPTFGRRKIIRFLSNQADISGQER